VKTCRICAVTKPLDQFYRDAALPDGRKARCKACEQAAPRKHRLLCSQCGRQCYANRNSRQSGEATCNSCRRTTAALRVKPKKTTSRACTGCGRMHRGSYPECYQCRRPNGWNGPTMSGATAEERAEQARERKKWKPVVEAGRAYCQQGLPGNGSSGTCVEPTRWIAPGSRWAVGHTDDRTARIGPVHHRCNHLDACSRGGLARTAKYRPQPGGGFDSKAKSLSL